MKLAAANAGLRVVTFGSRFVLSMFMAKFMSLEDIGIFALMTGVTGLLPSVAGLGFNYFMSRQLVGAARPDAVALALERLAVSLVMALVCVAGLLVVETMHLAVLPISPWMAGVIVILELLGFDMQVALLSRGRPVTASINLLLRSGAWVAPFVVAAFFVPSLRSIEALSWFWAGGLAISHITLATRYKSDLKAFLDSARSWKPSFVRGIGWQWVKIYLSDLGLAGSIYIDRFIITAIAGVRAAGVYFFFASVVNSVYVICMAASVQIYQPQLRAAYTKGGGALLRDTMAAKLKATIVISGAALLASAPALWLVMRFTGKVELAQTFDIVPVLLLAYEIKIVSDLLSVTLAAAERDMNYAVINIAGLVLTAAFDFVLIPIMGFRGAAYALLFATSLIVAARSVSLTMLFRPYRLQEVRR